MHFLVILVPPALADTTTFGELIALAARDSTTAQVVALDERISNASVGTAVSRVLPSVTLSENLTQTNLNEERYALDEESARDCETARGTPCDEFIIVEDTIVMPESTLSNMMMITARQTLWNTSAVMGIAQSKKRSEISDLQGEQRIEGQTLELISAYVELQFAVESVAIQERTLALAEESLAATLSASRSGRVTDPDVELAELELQQAQLELAQTNRAVARTLNGLWNTAGYTGGGAQLVCPLMEVSDRGEPLALDEATRVQISEHQVELDRINLTSSRLSVLPNLSASGGVSLSGNGDDLSSSFDDFGYNYWFVSGRLSWTLLSGGSRYFDHQASNMALAQSELTYDQELRDLSLADADAAAALQDFAEQLELLELQLALQERSHTATVSSYVNEGRVPLEAVLASSRQLEALRTKILSTRRQQVLTMVRRWIEAGQSEPLLSKIDASDRAYANVGRCMELTP